MTLGLGHEENESDRRLCEGVQHMRSCSNRQLLNDREIFLERLHERGQQARSSSYSVQKRKKAFVNRAIHGFILFQKKIMSREYSLNNKRKRRPREQKLNKQKLLQHKKMKLLNLQSDVNKWAEHVV